MRNLVLSLLCAFALSGTALGQNYASAVATSGREVLIGEPLNQYSPGLVYVYARVGGAWREGARLSASDGQPLDRFGRSLSLDGDRVLIGATSIDSSRGAAYLFERGAGGTWRQVQKLVPAGALAGDSWGRHVLLQGDMALLGSWGAKESRGAISLWRRGADGTWSEAGLITAGDGAPNDFFATSMAVDRDLLLVGAAQKDSARGAVYVFRRDPSGGYKEEAKITRPGTLRNTRFGSAVAFHHGQALIGMPGLDQNMGAVYVYGFDPAGNRWADRMRLAAFDGTPGAQFGSTVVVTPGEIWVGAPNADRMGRIYRFTQGPDSVYSGAAKLGHAEAARGDGFGGAIAMAGDLAIVGSPGDDHGAGTAVILTRGAGTWTTGTKVWSEERTLAAMTGARAECATGKVGVFDCGSVDLLAYLPVSAIGGGRGVRLNDVWGWTDPETGREYALVGRIDGTSMVDITDPFNPKFLVDVPKTEGSPAAGWRDIKVYKNHAFIVADGSDQHGMQVFDLTRLRSITSPRVLKPDLTYTRIASAHNIVIDTTSGFAFAVGSNGGGETCGGALHMIDIRDPRNPTFAGCFADPSTGIQRTGYTHDAQCVVYAGPDTAHAGRQICINSSETAIGIADVTDKANPKPLSRAAYPNVSYTHQGWLTDDQRYFYVNDEGDEVQGLVQGTRTLIWDVSDLDDPVLAGQFVSENKASDHNLYVKGNLMYQSNYASGLRILDISDPRSPKLVGNFDTNPVGVDAPGFSGSWSNYPYFKSETLVVTSIQEGLFLLKKASRPLVP
jgi:choice-of-anchor B domain-containing protein